MIKVMDTILATGSPGDNPQNEVLTINPANIALTNLSATKYNTEDQVYSNFGLRIPVFRLPTPVFRLPTPVFPTIIFSSEITILSRTNLS